METLLSFDFFIEIDFNRFDRRVSVEILQQVEFLFLTSPFPDAYDLHRAISLSWETVGISEFGTRYKVRGTRCSGDAWTSIGNGLLNKFMTWLCLRDIKHSSYHEGDDIILGIHSTDKDLVLHRLEFLSVLGFSAKIILRPELSQAVFCGRQLGRSIDTIISHCDLTRTLLKFNTTVSNGAEAPLLLAKARSYYSTDRDTPIIGQLCWSIITILGPVITKRQLKRAVAHFSTERYLPVHHGLDLTPPRVLPESRSAVELHTGINIATQEAYEFYYESWIAHNHIPSDVVRLPGEWDLTGNATIFFHDT